MSFKCKLETRKRHLILNIGPYSSFRLKTRFWGQNDKNFDNFSVTKDMFFVPGGWLVYDVKILVIESYLYRRSINGIKKASSGAMVTTFIMATESSKVLFCSLHLSQVRGIHNT